MFIQRLKELLKVKKITKKQFCEDIQINKNLPKYWEDNNTFPNRTIMNSIANYFDVSVSYLKGETNDPTPITSFNNSSASDKKEKIPEYSGISKKHIKLIKAYDNSEPAIQGAVDRLLGIEDVSSVYTVKIAARNGTFEERRVTKEEFEKLNSLPDVDKSL